GADDGILVWDRNANGIIDSGQELFGDETILSNGQKANHGFAALADLDTGHQVGNTMVGANDGVFNSNDARYADLRIWQDLNQDGINQADQLPTLAEAGITSINLASPSSNKSYGDAMLVQNGSFARADGSTGQAGSFVLAQNNFARQFPAITVTEDAQTLPDIKASGWVRDLQEAASLDPDLIILLTATQTASTRADYKAAIANLLREW